ncbi:MAG TPA: hypothetical protein DIW64_21475 [Cellvibrio sp.]|nr:hypothetical protein [Cellvibrio sp.]
MLAVAIVEDDKPIAQLISLWLEPYGYKCHCFESSEAFLASDWQSRGISLLLVDWQLPGISGIQLTKQLVSEPDCPAIIFVTSFGRADDVAQALHLGADDFVTKPVNKSVLLARIRAVMRRRGKDLKALNPELEVTLAPSSLEVVIRNGSRCRLSPSQYRTLEFLLRHEGQVVNRTALSEAIWGETESGQQGRALDLLISRLRVKLEALTDNPMSIVSHYGVGYACYRALPAAAASVNSDR